MPTQGNDNRSTRSWLPPAKAAPSASWNSTYGAHYRDPTKRVSRNRDYWLKRAAARAAATAQQEAEIAMFQHSMRQAGFHEPSLSLAYNTSIRNPSSMARSQSWVGGSPTSSKVGSLVAAPLSPSIRDTSRRSHNSFATHLSQTHYEQPLSVPALSVLHGQAAGAHTAMRNQATYRPGQQPSPFSMKAKTNTSDFLTYQQAEELNQQRIAAEQANGQQGERTLPVMPFDHSISHAQPSFGATAGSSSFSPSATQQYYQSPEQQQEQYELANTLPDPTQRQTGSATRSSLRSPPANTIYNSSPVARSQTFRPLLNASQSTPMLASPNTLRNSQQRNTLRRTGEFQVQEMAL